MSRISLALFLLSAYLYSAVGASADTLTSTSTVASTAVIYAAGSQSGVAAAAGGTLPTALTLASGSSYFTFSVPQVNGAAQTITLNNGTGNNNNDADGRFAAVSTSSNTGSGSISGITAPGAGYLTGVFVGAGGPSGAAPTALNFTTGIGTAFTSLNPLLDQVFFIGDGLTGAGTGSTQQFFVPQGATTLYLGISDAGGYNGSPGYYSDNLRSFNVVVTDVTTGSTVAVTPEPSGFVLLGTGILAVVGLVKYRAA